MRNLILFALAAVTPLCARPVAIPTLGELSKSAEIIVVIHPEATRETSDKPDDDSFGTRDLKYYQPLESTCRVVTVLKGAVGAETIKIVHFAWADRKPEFNGGFFISFLFDPTEVIVFPGTKNWKIDDSKVIPYANGAPEYLAFLRRLPDGRFAAATRQYDAALAFRVLATPTHAQRYHDPDAARAQQANSK